MAEDYFTRHSPLCVVGNINRDVKVQGVPGTPGLLRDGETSVLGIIETIGGGGANSACAAVSLGATVRFVGKVGADTVGNRLREAMEDHGVRTYLSCGQAETTGTTVALSFADGHRHFLSCLPNNESLTFEDLDLTALDGCTHVLRADVWFSAAMLAGGNQRLLAEARRRSITTSLDINYDPRWSAPSADDIARRKQLLRDVLHLVDVAHGNVSELCEFADSPNLETALQQLSDWGVKAVVVHMGAQGAGYFTSGRLTVEPPSYADSPVNITGTGDVLSMCMILLHAREDLSTEEKLRIANRVVREFMEGRRTMIPTI